MFGSSWQPGDTALIRNIARSDGTVTTAIPAIVISDTPQLLALYIPAGTRYKNNWVVAPADREASVASSVPSAQRAYRNLVMQSDSIRLYLSGCGFSIGLNFDAAGEFNGWYGNMEEPFVRTDLGIYTRDLALDVVADATGRWRWKDEEEFMRRLALGIDSPEQHAQVRRAGLEFVARLEHNRWPFNAGWRHWQPPYGWHKRHLPANWAVLTSPPSFPKMPAAPATPTYPCATRAASPY